MNTKLLFSAAAAALLAATPALANDWTGIYAGASVGFGSTSTSYDNPGTPHQSWAGASIGGRVGANYQFGNHVVVGASGTFLGIFGSDNVRDGNYIREQGSSPWEGLVLGRVGYAYGRFLPYLTGGLAIRQLDQGESCPSPALAPFGFCSKHGPFALSQSKVQVAPAVGAGLEYQVNSRVSVYAEYTHSFWQKTSFRLGPDALGSSLPVSRVRSGSDLVLVGLNYKFW